MSNIQLVEISIILKEVSGNKRNLKIPGETMKRLWDWACLIRRTYPIHSGFRRTENNDALKQETIRKASSSFLQDTKYLLVSSCTIN